MGNIITTVLTDTSARGTASIQQTLLEKPAARAWG